MKKRMIALIGLLFLSRSFAQDVTPPATPQNLRAFSYELHGDLYWDANTETDLAGYRIYALNGSNYTLYATVKKDYTFKMVWIGSVNTTSKYKIAAYDNSNNESQLGPEVEIRTHNMSDDEFLDMVQRATFRYFWDWGDPNSGVARERWQPNELDKTNTIGGGGFGVMAILVGIERGFITREQGAARLLKIADFLANKIEKFHGAFPHWFNGSTGKVVKFGVQDGGDLVETAFMIQGLLTARQYFNRSDATESQIRNLITQIWENVDWDFYRNGSGGLYWNWSPTMGFDFSDTFIFHGWNETHIAYILAVASPVKNISPNVYHSGWASNGGIYSLRAPYGYILELGSGMGGPLFFTHYSYLGFDPRGQKDKYTKYTDYFTHNKNQSIINRRYCIENPLGYKGYNENSWGLTASNSIQGSAGGYLAHEPGVNSRDNGTIAPMAALSAMPYIPNESLAALKYFYRTHREKLWGPFGFYDAFNLNGSSGNFASNKWTFSGGEWFSNGYLAIDQGPIICMIENYRNGLLWTYFMMNPEIKPALDKIGFVYDPTGIDEEELPAGFKLFQNYPNPFNPETIIKYSIGRPGNVKLTVFNLLGREVETIVNQIQQAGTYSVSFNALQKRIGSGIYFYKLQTQHFSETKKMILLR